MLKSLRPILPCKCFPVYFLIFSVTCGIILLLHSHYPLATISELEKDNLYLERLKHKSKYTNFNIVDTVEKHMTGNKGNTISDLNLESNTDSRIPTRNKGENKASKHLSIPKDAQISSDTKRQNLVETSITNRIETNKTLVKSHQTFKTNRITTPTTSTTHDRTTMRNREQGRAKSIKKTHRNHKRKQEKQDAMYNSTSADKKINEQCKKRLPQCIVIGSAKSGTTALLQYLGIHPDIAVAGGQRSNDWEIHFFDHNYHKGLDWYKNAMPCSFSHQITIEKTPNYFVQDDVPARIKSMNSSIKLILIVREPVDRTMSMYLQRLYIGKNPLDDKSFEGNVFKRDRTGKPEVDPNNNWIRQSQYDTHIKQWLKYFKKDQIKVLDGDAMTKNPVPVLKEVENFLGIRSVISMEDFTYDETNKFYCLKNKSIYVTTTCEKSGKGRKHPQINPKLRQKLTLYFQPHNQQFFNYVGKSFPW